LFIGNEPGTWSRRIDYFRRWILTIIAPSPPSGTEGGFGHSGGDFLTFILTISARSKEGKLQRLPPTGDGIVYEALKKMEWFVPTRD
jgi:hypothetical protein